MGESIVKLFLSIKRNYIILESTALVNSNFNEFSAFFFQRYAFSVAQVCHASKPLFPWKQRICCCNIRQLLQKHFLVPVVVTFYVLHLLWINMLVPASCESSMSLSKKIYFCENILLEMKKRNPSDDNAKSYV